MYSVDLRLESRPWRYNYKEIVGNVDNIFFSVSYFSYIDSVWTLYSYIIFFGIQFRIREDTRKGIDTADAATQSHRALSQQLALSETMPHLSTKNTLSGGSDIADAKSGVSKTPLRRHRRFWDITDAATKISLALYSKACIAPRHYIIWINLLKDSVTRFFTFDFFVNQHLSGLIVVF